jgi:hypothetical protein
MMSRGVPQAHLNVDEGKLPIDDGDDEWLEEPIEEAHRFLQEVSQTVLLTGDQAL